MAVGGHPVQDHYTRHVRRVIRRMQVVEDRQIKRSRGHDDIRWMNEPVPMKGTVENLKPPTGQAETGVIRSYAVIEVEKRKVLAMAPPGLFTGNEFESRNGPT